MATGVAVGTTNFVLGKEGQGNREVRTYMNGESYSLDIAAITAYTVQTTKFPYNVA